MRMLKQVVKYEADGKQALPAGADDGIFFHWLWSYGGDFLNADKTQAATTTPEALAAAEWYARMHTGGPRLHAGRHRQAGRRRLQPGQHRHQRQRHPQQPPGLEPLPLQGGRLPAPAGWPASRVAGGRINRMYIDGYLLFKGSKYRDATVDFLFWLLDEGAVSVEKQGGVNIPVYKKGGRDGLPDRLLSLRPQEVARRRAPRPRPIRPTPSGSRT